MELKIANSPIVGLQYLAYPLTVLLNYEECFPWFYSNYIQIAWNSNLEYKYTIRFFGGWYTEIPLLDYQIMEKATFLKSKCNIVDFIINALNDGWYISSNFDEFYVPNRKAFERIHYGHDFMIYGYEPTKELLLVLGYSDKDIFEKTKISYSDFLVSYTNKVNEDITHLVLFKKKEDISCDFDKVLVKDLVTDYLYSKNTNERFRMIRKPDLNNVFGMEIYKYLKKYYNSFENENDDVIGDIRNIHMFWEHKICMLKRLQFMLQKGIFNHDDYIKKYELVEMEISKIRNLQIKYCFSKDKVILENIVDSLLLAEKKEQEVLENVLEEIS